MELIPNIGLPRVAAEEPAGITVQPGKVYSWCSCGLSGSEPFCDSAHKQVEGMPYRSVKVMFDKTEEVLFCQCKQTKTPPFCDGTHKTLRK
ncbi:MAG: CDGSH iron-sulfur domain-containing protein [Chitinophagaceae bacterium]|nr:CDGSH iron-sulfur domain-containing protein [Chitinophagaceae bacterium]